MEHYSAAVNPCLARIKAFNKSNGGGVTVASVRGGYNLYLAATQAPIARLQPEGSGDRMRLRYWSYRQRWKDVGDMGGLMPPLDQAFEEIAKNDLFWTWT